MERGTPIMEAHEPVNILMVDDQPGKLRSYEVILSELGENLIQATSANEALEYLLKTDTLLLDSGVFTDQQLNECTQQCFASLADVVHKLDEPRVERKFPDSTGLRGKNLSY